MWNIEIANRVQISQQVFGKFFDTIYTGEKSAAFESSEMRNLTESIYVQGRVREANSDLFQVLTYFITIPLFFNFE